MAVADSLVLARVSARSDYVEQVHRALLDAICDGSLAPGVRITQEEIAERMSVSRSPVLQALRLLKKDGFIHDAPGRGVQVAPLDAVWTGKLYDVRGALDGLAVRLAAQRGARLDPRLIDEGRAAAAGADMRRVIDADLAFHAAIYAASGNELIVESTALHWTHLRRVMGAVLQPHQSRATIWDEHAAIADALAQRDAERAVVLTELHVTRARTNLLDRLGAAMDKARPPALV